jgi:hypothetical protein
VKIEKLNFTSARRGFLTVDLAVAMSILALAMIPLAVSFAHETKLLRAEYDRAVAIEIVDGEMEILAAGDWKNFPDGAKNYPVHANAAASLPPGNFELTKVENHLRLEWKSDEHDSIGPVMREITIK